MTRLRTIRGIGEWTAQYIALRAIREMDAFPATDVGLLRSVAAMDGAPRNHASGSFDSRRILAAVASLCGATSLGRGGKPCCQPRVARYELNTIRREWIL